MADSVAQTRQIIDIETVGKAVKTLLAHFKEFQEKGYNAEGIDRERVQNADKQLNGDAIKSCIEKLNNACQCQNNVAVFGDHPIVLYSKSCDKHILVPTTDASALDAFDAIPVEDSEKHLKKLIKHAKTPMERKAYEKQLNALYKKKKRKI